MLLEYYENREGGFQRERVEILGRVKYGIEAFFIPISDPATQKDKVGLKLYKTVGDGKMAHFCQSKAHSHKLAPEVISGFMEFVFPLGSERVHPHFKNFFVSGKAYGYYTQLADIIPMDGVDYDQLQEDKRHLEADCIKYLSFSVSDLHYNNIGYLGKRLVIIDWGWHTHSQKENEQPKIPTEHSESVIPVRLPGGHAIAVSKNPFRHLEQIQQLSRYKKS